MIAAATVTVTAAAATRPSGLFWSLARAVPPPPALAMHWQRVTRAVAGTVLALHARAGPPQPAQVAGGLSLSAGVPWPGWQPAWPRPRPGYGPGIRVRVTRKVGH